MFPIELTDLLLNHIFPTGVTVNVVISVEMKVHILNQNAVRVLTTAVTKISKSKEIIILS